MAQLQRYRCADDGRLPIKLDAETTHPAEPVVARLLQKLARDRVDGAFEWLVGAEDQRDRMRQRERRLVRDVGQRRVGREPHDIGAAGEAHMI
jgi:hypothetical protein